MDELPISQINNYIKQVSEELYNVKPKPFNSKVKDMVELIIQSLSDYPKNVEGYELPKVIQIVPDNLSLERYEETKTKVESLLTKLQSLYPQLDSVDIDTIENTNSQNKKYFEEIEAFRNLASAQTEVVELKQFYLDSVDFDVFKSFAKDHEEDFLRSYLSLSDSSKVFNAPSLKEISQKVHDSNSDSSSSSAYSGDRPFKQYFGNAVTGQRYDIPKYSNASILRQIMYFDSNNTDWYMTVLSQIQQWKAITSPDAWGSNTSNGWEGFKSGLETFGKAVGAVQDAAKQISTLLDINKQKFQRFVKNYRQSVIDNVNNPKWLSQNQQAISVGNQTNPTIYRVSHDTFLKNAEVHKDTTLANMANIPLIDLITNLRNNGLIFDNTYDILIRRKLRKGKKENKSFKAQTDTEIKILCVRSQGLNLEGKKRATTKFKWKNNEEVPKPLGRFEQNKVQSLTFDLDQNFFTLQKIAEYSNYLNFYEIQSGKTPDYFYKKFGSFIQPRNPYYQYDIEVVIYNGFSANTNVESVLKNKLTEAEYASVYVYEDVNFLGINSAPTYTIAGGNPLSFSTEFTYLRGYFQTVNNIKAKIEEIKKKREEEEEKLKQQQQEVINAISKQLKKILSLGLFTIPELSAATDNPSSDSRLTSSDWTLRPIVPTNLYEQPLCKLPSAQDLGIIGIHNKKDKVNFGKDGLFVQINP